VKRAVNVSIGIITKTTDHDPRNVRRVGDGPVVWGINCTITPTATVHGTTVGRTHSWEQWIGAHAQPLHEVRQACVCRWAGRRGPRPVRINTDAAKSELLAALKLPRGHRGSWHFSRTLRGNIEFLAQMQSEEVRAKLNPLGMEVGREWVKTRERNEAWDLATMSIALWHFVTDKALYQHCEQLMGREEAHRQWLAAYPSGRRY
jgi:hypothetical protein